MSKSRRRPPAPLLPLSNASPTTEQQPNAHLNEVRPSTRTLRGSVSPQSLLLPNWALAITYLSPGELKVDPRRPRRSHRQQNRSLKRSIGRFGFITPVLIDGNKKIIAGHARVQAALDLGLEKIPAVFVEHLSEEEAALFMVADNKLAEMSAWDDELLGTLFKDLSLGDLTLDLEDTGFSMGEIDLFIEGVSDHPVNPHSDLDDTLPPVGPEVTKLGDLWVLGRHRVLCGNALESTSWSELMAGERAEMVCTDFPYNVRIPGHASGNGSTQHRNFVMASGEMSVPAFTNFLEVATSHLVANSHPGSLHYLFMDWRHIEEIQAACRKNYHELKNVCVWVKSNAGMGSLYRSQHELVFVYKNGNTPHRNNVQLGQYGRNRSNVWTFPGANTFGRSGEEGNLLALHPTVKPVALMANAILDASARGDIVLDAFLGSGTAVIAAERTGRRAFGLELDPAYVDVIVRRWQRYTGEQARHAVTGKTFDESAETKEADHAAT